MSEALATSGMMPKVKMSEADAKKYLGLIHHIARAVKKASPPSVTFDELVSEGSLGMLEAWDRFDHSRGFRFVTYAYKRIKGRMFDYITSRGRQERSVDFDGVDSEGVDNSFEARVEATIMLRSLSEMPMAEHSFRILRHLNDGDTKVEISKIDNVHPSTVIRRRQSVLIGIRESLGVYT